MLRHQSPKNLVMSVALGATCLALAACSASSQSTAAPTSAPAAAAAPTAAAPLATAAPPTAAAAPTTAAPTAVARPTQPATTASGTSTPGATTSSDATAASKNATASDAVTLIIDSSASQASYHAREQLAGNTLPSDAVGTSKSVTGSLVFAPDGSIVADKSQITVDLTALQSDESRRDNFIKNNTLETSRFPTAVFVPRGVQGLPTPLPTSGEATFQLSGDLTVHGVTKPATWQVTAQFAGSNVTGSATTGVNITDFGMTPPKVGPVLGIEDALKLELAFTAARQA